jgi:hypothetical protein
MYRSDSEENRWNLYASGPGLGGGKDQPVFVPDQEESGPGLGGGVDQPVALPDDDEEESK